MQRVPQEHPTGCGFGCIAMLVRQSNRSVMNRAEKLEPSGPVGPHRQGFRNYRSDLAPLAETH